MPQACSTRSAVTSGRRSSVQIIDQMPNSVRSATLTLLANDNNQMRGDKVHAVYITDRSSIIHLCCRGYR
jgi:hypothetical protein